MPFIAGLLSGVLLTVLTVFIVDLSVQDRTPGSEPQKIVNWDVAAEKLSSSLASLQQQVQEDVHEATR